MAKTTVASTVPLPNLQKLWKRGYMKVKLFRRPTEKVDPREVAVDPPTKPQGPEFPRKEGQESLFVFGEDSKHENLNIFNFTFTAGEDLKRDRPRPPWELSETISQLVAKLYKLKIEDLTNRRRPRQLEILPAEIRQAIIENLFGEPSANYSIRGSNNFVAPAFDIVAIRALAASSSVLAGDIVQIGSIIARRLLQRLQHLRELSKWNKISMKKAGCPCLLCDKHPARKNREAQSNIDKNPTEAVISSDVCPPRIQHETLIVEGYTNLLLRIVARIARRSVRKREALEAEQMLALQELKAYRASKDL